MTAGNMNTPIDVPYPSIIGNVPTFDYGVWNRVPDVLTVVTQYIYFVLQYENDHEHIAAERGRGRGEARRERGGGRLDERIHAPCLAGVQTCEARARASC